jgi:hypothetical protein
MPIDLNNKKTHTIKKLLSLIFHPPSHHSKEIACLGEKINEKKAFKSCPKMLSGWKERERVANKH